MGLSPRGESETTLSDPSVNEMVEQSEADVKDTFVNRTAISPARYSDIYGTLMGFPEGAIIEVEYYSSRTPMLDKQTKEIDLSSFRHSVHTDYTLIHNFEIKLDGPLDITYDEESTELSVAGHGIVYPGFVPTIGDPFLYELPDEQIGIFVVTNISRLSIQQGSYHKITISLWKFADEDELTKLNTSVNDESYFDKQKYLAGNATLLKSEEYQYLKKLKRYRTRVVDYYFNKFYKDEFDTIMKPETNSDTGEVIEIYDPYVVEYLHTKVSLFDQKKRPMQVYPEVTDHHSSIWFAMTEGEAIDIASIKYKNFVVQHQSEIWDAVITALINKPFIHLDDTGSLNEKTEKLIIGDDENASYVFSNEFYSGDTDNMSEFETIVYQAITEGSIEVKAFVDNYLTKFKEVAEEDQFYQLCVYIHLTDLSIAQLT